MDLWRLKIWDLEKGRFNYRIIYAYQISNHCFHMLAVVHRDFNYEPNHPITKRILNDYSELT